MVKHKNYPVPKGKSDVKINLLFDQDINCKNVTYEIITKYGASAGIKRKRVAATGDADDEDLQESSGSGTSEPQDAK